MDTLLTVDLGNSRLKACAWDARAHVQASFVLEGADLAAFEAWLRGHPVRRAALSSVASPVTTGAVRELLARCVPTLLVAPVAPLENHCRRPETVGPDRLYAALGAALLLGTSALVVNVGTALTVDALRVVGERRAFLGGAIAPGPALLARSLAEGTARLPRVQPRPGVPALGGETEEAVLAGVVHGLRGAALHLVEEVAREAELGAAPVVLSGGARALLLEPQPFTVRRVLVEAELVQRGLLEALRAAGSGA